MVWTPPTEPETTWAIPTESQAGNGLISKPPSTFSAVVKPASSVVAVQEDTCQWVNPQEGTDTFSEAYSLLCEDGQVLTLENNQPFKLEDKLWGGPSSSPEETWERKSPN